MSRAHPRFTRVNPSLPAAVPNTFQVSVIGSYFLQQTINTFYYRDGGAPLGPSAESNLASGWAASFLADYLNTLSNEYSVNAIKVTCLTTPSRAPFVSNQTGSGQVAGTGLPPTVGITIDRFTAIKGQAGRGHITLPAVPSTYEVSGSLRLPLAAALTTFAVDSIAGFTYLGTTYTAQLVSRKNKAGPPLGSAPLTSFLIRTGALGTANRRKVGRGS